MVPQKYVTFWLAIILIFIIGVIALSFPRNPAENSQVELTDWRTLDVDENSKAFDAPSSNTDFLLAATDDAGQHLILGLSGVPWIATLNDDWILSEPILLSESQRRFERPEQFAINRSIAVYVANERIGEKGGGVYSDFDLFDPLANEYSRYYRFNFRTGSAFHTLAGITVVNRTTGRQVSLRPFDDIDSRLIALRNTSSGFAAGGYIVPIGQLGTVPALTTLNAVGQDVRTYVFVDDFRSGSHWIDDVVEIDDTTLLVAGASTMGTGMRRDDLTGWIGIVDTESGAFRRAELVFPAKSRIFLQRNNDHIFIATGFQVIFATLQGKRVWSRLNRGTFVPRSTLLDQSGSLWVAGSAVSEEWGGWIAKYSSDGKFVAGSFHAGPRNGPRFVDLLPHPEGGVVAVGRLFCRRSLCGEPFARGFVLKFGAEGQIEEGELARFEMFSHYREPDEFYDAIPDDCTPVDAAVCNAIDVSR